MPGRLCLLGLVVMTVGCATARFKVPAEEVQRLVQLPASERGKEVRVIPWKSPTGELSPAQPAPTYQPPEAGEPNVVAQIDFEPNFDLPGSRGRLRGHRSSYARPVAHPPNPGNGTFRGFPMPRPRSPSGHGPWEGTPRPSPTHGLGVGSGHGGGGKGGAVVVAAVVGVVAVVALAAVIADASAKAEARARLARTYDGWVAVGPEHVLHLNYGPKVNRVIPLSQLSADDTVGLRFGYLETETNGQVVPLPLPPVYPPWPQPPAPLTPPPVARPPAPVPAPPAPAPENVAPPWPGRAPEQPDLVS